MAESNAVLELKAALAKAKAELKEKKWEHTGRLLEALGRKSLALDALHMVWCSGGCCGGVKEPVTPEMVAYVEAYTARLRTWFVAHEGRQRIKRSVAYARTGGGYPGRPGSVEFNELMDDYHKVWEEARGEIDVARARLEEGG